MSRLALALSVARYLAYAVLSVLSVLVVWALAPLVVRLVEDDPVTGQGDLPRGLRWMRSHDFPLDEVWRPSLRDGSEDWREDGLFIKNFDAFDGLTTADFLASRALRTRARWLWLWRNPAYGFRARVLGFPMAGAVTIYEVRCGADWDSGRTSWSIAVAERPGANVLVRTAFHVRGQAFYWPGSSRYVRVNVGWKLVMPDIAMVATHINPFRKVELPFLPLAPSL